MLPVLRAAQRVPGIETTVVAQQPASDELRRHGFAVETIEARIAASVESADFDDVLRAAGALLERHRPEAILTGMSGPGAGIDEALIVRAGRTATYAVQDFGGSAVPPAGCVARTYFVGDDEAAGKFSTLDVDTVVVGPLQYVGFPSTDPARYRLAERPEPGISFFGQPQWHLDGYGRALQSLAHSVKSRWPAASLVYRPHPKETRGDSDRAAGLFDAAGVRAVIDGTSPLERALAEPDLVVTCFSACGLDHIVMHSKSSQPLGCVLYLLTQDDLRAHLLADTGERVPWPVRRGFALVAQKHGDVGPLMERALAPTAQRELWQRLRAGVGLARARPELVLETICRHLSPA